MHERYEFTLEIYSQCEADDDDVGLVIDFVIVVLVVCLGVFVDFLEMQ